MSNDKITVDVYLHISDEPVDVREKTVALLSANPRRAIRDRLKSLQTRVAANLDLEGAEDELASIQREWFQDTPKGGE